MRDRSQKASEKAAVLTLLRAVCCSPLHVLPAAASRPLRCVVSHNILRCLLSLLPSHSSQTCGPALPRMHAHAHTHTHAATCARTNATRGLHVYKDLLYVLACNLFQVNSMSSPSRVTFVILCVCVCTSEKCVCVCVCVGVWYAIKSLV